MKQLKIIKQLEKSLGLSLALLEADQLENGGPGYVLDERDNVVALKLSDLGLERLGPSVFFLNTLEILYLDGNRLEELSGSVRKLTSLRVLNLEYNQLTELPLELGVCLNLKELYLWGNPVADDEEQRKVLDPLEKHFLKVSIWPGEEGRSVLIQDYSFIEFLILQLGGRELEWCEDGKLKTGGYVKERGFVTELALPWGVELEEVLPIIFGFKQLKTLWLRNLGLKKLSGEIGKLRHLKELRLEGNELDSLPSELRELKGLEFLVLDEECFAGRPEILELVAESGEVLLVDGASLTRGVGGG